MQVKVFEAKDMASGLKMVKEALGPDALILSTRTIRSGTFGMIGKPMMEITAAIDNNWQEPVAAPAGRQPQPKPRPRDQNRQELSYQEIWAQDEPKPAPPPARPYHRQPPPGREIEDELAELRDLVKGLSHRITGMDAPGGRKTYVEPEYSAPISPKSTVDPAISFLTGHGINPETAQVVARFTRDTIGQARDLNRHDLTAIFKAAIARLFTTEQLLATRPTRQRRLSLIGPTGVGKTTTLAKIAAHYLSQFGGRIALITIDTYRIAAVEQLKVYGEIMRLPVEVVLSPRELDQALDKFRDYDLILIDTAGRSPRNGIDLQELATFLRPELGLENNLLLSATTRERELEETIKHFSILPINNFIFSKIDECDQLGVLLNIHYQNDTPISFLTNGQRVPEDLIMPSPETIADLIMNDYRIPHHG